MISRPPNWQHISTLDAHAEGEPLRIVTDGVDPVPGASMVEKRRFAREHLDSLRRTLMFEPRGHADMYGAILTEPVTPDGDVGVLFMHNEGWSTMCGHGIIALTAAGIEAKLFGVATPHNGQHTINFDTPAGRVTSRATIDNDRVIGVAFENVPSFAYALDQEIDVRGVGRVRYDIGFGGAFYAYVDAQPLGLELVAERYRDLIDTAMAIKRAVMAARDIVHPFERELSFLYGTILYAPPHEPAHHARNVCVFAEGEVDRSPTGTGVSGRVALEHARGRLGIGEPFTIESILGTTFTGKVLRATRFGPHDAVVPEVSGRAWLTGRNEFWLAPDDPLRAGFILR